MHAPSHPENPLIAIPCRMALALVAIAGAARSSAQVVWTTDEVAGVQAAQREDRPVVFWFAANERRGYRSRHNALDNQREAIRSAFNDSRVVAAARPFIMVQSDFRAERKKLREQLHPNANDVILTTPTGDELGRIKANDARNSEKLAEGLATAAAKYCEILYKQKFRPVLLDESASADDLRKSLKRVEDLGVAAADTDVIAVLGRENLPTTVRTAGYDALASLSTQKAVDELLQQSVDTPPADAALRKCKPPAAQMLADHLDGDPTPTFLHAYRAAATIARLSAPKSDEWWAKADEAARNAEVQRCKARIANARMDRRK